MYDEAKALDMTKLALQELDGQLAAVKIQSWQQYLVLLTPVGGNPFAAKFFRFHKKGYFDYRGMKATHFSYRSRSPLPGTNLNAIDNHLVVYEK
ncbi:hypothetical protein Taro_022549 [Colocasia esculenta]|uniref:Uncharacterized protein n=1 Tax=Colocasia esculenta TaxID=4460 RepID=A0A843VES9_COLES|nr:hypothetical protein [Colocasia esculenta]